MIYEHDVSVSNHHTQRVPVITHLDVLALLFCTSERSALLGFRIVQLLDKLLSCRRITRGSPRPRVSTDCLAENLADNHASDVATT